MARGSSSSRLDRGLGFLQARGVQRGVFGTSRPWLWIALASFGLRRARKILGAEPEVVWRGQVKPGHVIRIDHLTEEYGGPPRRRGLRRRS